MLEIKELSKSFGKLLAVDRVSFKVNEGDFIGIIGPNGAGKTVVFNLITGHLKPDAGSIIFRNKRIEGLGAHEIAKKGITRTFQIPRPFKSLTVFENIYVAGIAKENDKKKLLDEIPRLLENLGLLKAMDRTAGSLSTGELKYLELARAMITKPQLLLLDEPFAGLGDEEIERLAHILKELHDDGMTIILIEHVLKQLMKIVGKVIVLHHGEKIAEASPAEVTTNKSVIEAYLGVSKIA